MRLIQNFIWNKKEKENSTKEQLQAVLRIRDVYTGSRIQGQKDPWSGTATLVTRRLNPILLIVVES